MCSNDRTAENFEKVKKVLDGMGIKYTIDEEEKMFRFSMEITSKITCITYRVVVFDDAVLVCALSPIAAPYKDRKLMREVTEMICRINYGFRIGSFDLDVRDGQLIFRCYVDFEDVDPSDGMIENAIVCPSSMFCRYGDAIADVFFGAASAKEAVFLAEHSDKVTGWLDGVDDSDSDDGDSDDNDDDDVDDVDDDGIDDSDE